MSTTLAKPGSFQQKWYVIDAADLVVGRLAVTIATMIRGKHKPDYTPHIDTGDFIIVVNAEKVRFTGTKMDTKTYSAYSHYPGGLRTISAKDLIQRRPGAVLEAAVRRMVPRNRLGRAQMGKLKIYAGNRHPHQAQNPQELKIAQ